MAARKAITSSRKVNWRFEVLKSRMSHGILDPPDSPFQRFVDLKKRLREHHTRLTFNCSSILKVSFCMKVPFETFVF